MLNVYLLAVVCVNEVLCEFHADLPKLSCVY